MIAWKKVLAGGAILIQVSGFPAVRAESPNADSWRAAQAVDSMSDKTVKMAIANSDRGDRVAIYRANDGSVWMNFSLSDQDPSTLANKGFLFRIDKHAPHDTESNKGLEKLGIAAYDWTPRWINTRIWHGKESDGRSSALDELMNGQMLTIRYYKFIGGWGETSFRLTDARQAIATTLDISETPSAEDVASAKAKKERTARDRAYMQKCQDEFRATKDLGAYRGCLALRPD